MCPDYALQQGAGQESMHVAAGGNGCSVCVIQGCPSPIMWHQHFGYPSKRVFQDMVFQQSCHGFPEQLVPTVPWETCANAKSKKKPSSLGLTLCAVNKPLQLIVVYLCGPFQETLVGGAAYFLQICDMYLTHVKVYTIANMHCHGAGEAVHFGN